MPAGVRGRRQAARQLAQSNCWRTARQTAHDICMRGCTPPAGLPPLTCPTSPGPWQKGRWASPPSGRPRAWRHRRACSLLARAPCQSASQARPAPAQQEPAAQAPAQLRAAAPPGAARRCRSPAPPVPWLAAALSQQSQRGQAAPSHRRGRGGHRHPAPRPWLPEWSQRRPGGLCLPEPPMWPAQGRRRNLGGRPAVRPSMLPPNSHRQSPTGLRAASPSWPPALWLGRNCPRMGPRRRPLAVAAQAGQRCGS
mmetsp:Transcript_36874/g.113619  ORF Transcript_36874/g.113619 Transcript_36874/m.113619 type:complete len:253 (+) Transcript_36874:344-1102(+)